jgi:hypothetical protein
MCSGRSTSKRRATSELRGIKIQKSALFIVIAVRITYSTKSTGFIFRFQEKIPFLSQLKFNEHYYKTRIKYNDCNHVMLLRCIL